MIKYKYKLKYMDEFNIVVLDFDEEKSLEFANMISDPLGSDIPWRFKDLKNDIDNYVDLLRGNITEYRHGGNASSVISYRDYTIIEDPFYDDEEDEIEPICKLETTEFVIIILVWAYETYRYKSERGVIPPKEAEMVMNWFEQKMIEVKSIENNV
ncbi:hypothetical protein J2T12_000893 [Paenibacillus anaericanus]|uniref:hypothetical protein n=1 Tax=Paenibacillus anaericanus TaxID=170367 RepID=UPI00277F9B07|nr:hypothetical protein [Paenibacillus anaericanus]MDQ0087499.1 hypothetical protein [Paenibacillus anaericanus]